MTSQSSLEKAADFQEKRQTEQSCASFSEISTSTLGAQRLVISKEANQLT